ncbi:unnamed protein product [Cylindrotheca closterium]|uniref:Kinesin light chain n=1 Tax=Cylindrotheca closterium TaxID=2856 RepID=A0AAD2JIT0_9STRA|nr:unnamed protein product [Cylindrotheca closterium]
MMMSNKERKSLTIVADGNNHAVSSEAGFDRLLKTLDTIYLVHVDTNVRVYDWTSLINGGIYTKAASTLGANTFSTANDVSHQAESQNTATVRHGQNNEQVNTKSPAEENTINNNVRRRPKNTPKKAMNQVEVIVISSDSDDDNDDNDNDDAEDINTINDINDQKGPSNGARATRVHSGIREPETKKALGDDAFKKVMKEAGILKDKGRYNDAINLCKPALQIRMKILGEDRLKDIYVADAYDTVGICLRMLTRYQEAMVNFKIALEIHLAVRGDQHVRTAQSYHNIGDVLKEQKKLNEALSNYQKACDIRSAVLGNRHVCTAESYYAIGVLLGHQKQYDKALNMFQKALEVRLEKLGNRHPQVGALYYDIGIALARHVKYKEAMKAFHQTLAIQREVLGDRHKDVADTYRWMGCVLTQQNQHTKARVWYQQALGIFSEIYGEGHELLRPIRQQIAYLDWKLQGPHARPSGTS